MQIRIHKGDPRNCNKSVLMHFDGFFPQKLGTSRARFSQKILHIRGVIDNANSKRHQNYNSQYAQFIYRKMFGISVFQIIFY